MISSWKRILPTAMRARLENRPNLNRAIDNSGWLLVDRLLRLSLGFILGIWIARYLGPQQFGTLNYATAFVAMFSSLASLGMDKIVVRELIRDGAVRDEVLGTAFGIRLGGSAITISVVFLAIMLIRPDDLVSRIVVAIISLASVFQALDVIDFWFESQVASKYSVWARTLAFLVAAGVRLALLVAQAPLIYFAYAILLEAVVGGVLLIAAYQFANCKVWSWRWSRNRAITLLHDSWPLIFSGIAVIAYMRIDVIMLGEMIGDDAAGVYSAATRLSEAWYFLPTIILASVFPSIVASRQVDQALYMSRLQRVYTLMTWLSILTTVPMALFSDEIVLFVYGHQYREAGRVLGIHAWGSIAVFMGLATTQSLLAENRQKISLYRTLIGLGSNIVLNLIFIPLYGVAGAAFATVISYSFATFSIGFFSGGWQQIVMLANSINPYRLLRQGK